MNNIKDTLLSQYANSPIICSLIEDLNEAIDPENDIHQFYTLAFNLYTAKGFGLDIWASIVGIDRNINIPLDETKVFGFKSDIDSFQPFNTLPFSAGGSGYNAYQLTDERFRTLILIKAASNILLATAPNINRFLRYIFPNKRSYFLITDHMKARYFFEFMPTPFERYIIYQLEVLPKPSGVWIDYQEIPPNNYFGFFGTGLQTFNYGAFL